MSGRRTSLAQDLLLVALEPATGKVRLPSTASEATLGGAALVDLVLLGRLELVMRLLQPLLAPRGPPEQSTSM